MKKKTIKNLKGAGINLTYPKTVRIHTCSVCGKSGEWGDEWTWWGAIKDDESGGPFIVSCSDRCREKLNEVLSLTEKPDQLRLIG